MKSLNSFFVLTLSMVCFLGFIFIFQSDSYSNKFERPGLPHTPAPEQMPVGELIAGFRLEQPIDWNLTKDVKLNGSDKLCVDILLATYGDRDNTGTFSASLQTEHFSEKILFDAHKVRDNVYHRFCYNSPPLGDLTDKPATFVLEGIDSPPDKAITAWMTSDTTRGKARLNNQEINESLIFSIDVVTESNKQRMQAIILTLLCGLSISILFWPARLKS